jgi:hypothetical protein
MPDVLRLKARHATAGCHVTTSFLMRAPLTQYLSFYHYYIHKKQTGTPGPNDRGPDASGAAAWGKDAAEWAINVKDMQVRVINQPYLFLVV